MSAMTERPNDDVHPLVKAFDDPILPAEIYRNCRTGEPMWTRAEWEQFGRLRRWRDLLLWWQPRKPRDERTARLEAKLAAERRGRWS